MFELKVTTDFAAAHQLDLTGRKCENLHGHNWKIEVFATGKKLDKSGVLVDFGIIKKRLKQVMNTLDHKFLNELDLFPKNLPPSSENIARYIGLEMEKLLNKDKIEATISKITAWESDNAAASWINSDA
ncbi:MAG: 6-carboxytetrahydropterin synthase QueD [Deltaproteobacteria bacterium]|nr:6-carboxytetrahydropterin synthase QueD [Deltaproteobacteria bacterium]